MSLYMCVICSPRNSTHSVTYMAPVTEGGRLWGLLPSIRMDRDCHLQVRTGEQTEDVCCHRCSFSARGPVVVRASCSTQNEVPPAGERQRHLSLHSVPKHHLSSFLSPEHDFLTRIYFLNTHPFLTTGTSFLFDKYIS